MNTEQLVRKIMVASEEGRSVVITAEEARIIWRAFQVGTIQGEILDKLDKS